MTAPDDHPALAPLVALAERLELVSGYCPADEHDAGRYAAFASTAKRLRAAIAEARQAVDALVAERDAARADVADLVSEGIRQKRRAIAAEAERDQLREAHRDLVSRLGFGDNRTEPMADNDTIVRYWDEINGEAAEWRESQRWRNDCLVAGHPDDEDCWECDPDLILLAAREALGRVEALADEWVREDEGDLPFSPDRTADLRAALAQPANPDVGERCGECRLGLGVHRPSDPLCRHYRAQPATDCTGAADCRAAVHEHGCFADIDGMACTDPSDHQPATDEEAGQ